MKTTLRGTICLADVGASFCHPKLTLVPSISHRRRRPYSLLVPLLNSHKVLPSASFLFPYFRSLLLIFFLLIFPIYNYSVFSYHLQGNIFVTWYLSTPCCISCYSLRQMLPYEITPFPIHQY